MPITRRTKPTFALTQSTEITIKRSTGSSMFKGRKVQGGVEVIVLEANVQPLQFKDIMQMTEADRTKEWIKVFSRDEIRTAKEGANPYDADIIIWEGFEYKVMKAKSYKMGILDHYAVLAARFPISASALS